MNQSTHQILMVRPKNFGFNEETAGNNHFQTNSTKTSDEVSASAISEFDAATEVLQNAGVEVLVIDDTEHPIKTDAVFPNNWFSTHQNGSLITYPMFAENRRSERRQDVIDMLISNYKYRHLHFEEYESSQQYLESTGSLVLDRIHKKAYACLSERTHPGLLDKFCVLMDYENIMFRASDEHDRPIYHTNVMMAIGTHWAIVCSESIRDLEEKSKVLESLSTSGKELIDIRLDQMTHFLGNAIELVSKDGGLLCVMSKLAYDVLSNEQKTTIEKYATILPIPIPTIETAGGGSIRCMIAEIF